MKEQFGRSAGRCRRYSAIAVAVLIFAFDCAAQCPVDVVVAGLNLPLGITETNQLNLIVGETGNGAAGSGRISLVDPTSGVRTTLLSGLPSGINDVNEPSGPSGVLMQGRTLYVLIGVGDAVRAGPFPGTTMANPAGASSPIFSSLLAVHFSAKAEKDAASVTLSPADQAALAAGGTVTLGAKSSKVTINLVANFPDYTPNPIAIFPANVRASNPFDLAIVGDSIYVTDGGMNLVWRVDTETGTFGALAAFAPIPNPYFPTLGGPSVEAVPTGITYSDGRLLVTLFRGFPFPPLAAVQQVDPETGAQGALISGLKSAIDVAPDRDGGLFVLQHASNMSPFLNGIGVLLHYAVPGGTGTTVANCLARPTSMVVAKRTGTVYITELVGGRVVAIVSPL